MKLLVLFIMMITISIFMNGCYKIQTKVCPQINRSYDYVRSGYDELAHTPLGKDCEKEFAEGTPTINLVCHAMGYLRTSMNILKGN